MRGSCWICKDVFDDQVGISAIRCGHTFHEGCLARWLNHNNTTCPQCLKKCSKRNIIPRLIWNETDGKRSVVVVRKMNELRKEIGITRENLVQKERENAYLTGQVTGFKNMLADACVNYRSLEMLHRQDLEAIFSLRRELYFHQEQQSEADDYKRQVKTRNRKIRNLQKSRDSIKVKSQEAIAKSQELKHRVQALSKELASHSCELKKTKFELAYYKDCCTKTPDTTASSCPDNTANTSLAQCLSNKRIKLETSSPDHPNRDVNMNYIKLNKRDMNYELK